jgi:HD-GYP domain-containing protein (c-di-GMP phosphodiesterase class II)
MRIGETIAAVGTRLGQASDAAALKRLVELGIALSAERNHDRLLERIMLGAMELANADGGTLYLRTDEDKLHFEIIRNHSLGIAMGGTTGRQIPFPSLAMFQDQTRKIPNHSHVATHVALTGMTSVIDDAYAEAEFDFSGTRHFDEGTGYRSTSFLTVPLKNRQQAVIGVLQLLNALDRDAATVIPFAHGVIPLIEALGSQAAIALDNQRLIDEQRNLFDAFINLMAGAIDAKSAYTGGHCQRVPVLTEMLAEAACQAEDGPFADFNLTDEQWYELRVAGGLHDVGKVTTPTHVMDKSTKLEKICDRIDEIRVRAEVIRRDITIAYLEGTAAGEDASMLAARRDRALAELSADVETIAQGNIGGEFMSDAAIARLAEVAKRRWSLEGAERPLLTEDELMNLSIRRGTLNDAERKIINDHIVLTIQMLERLPFPKHLRNVPELAGGHHEKMDGTGYPKRLKRHEMSVPARMMGVADIFEALTAADRPYKKPKALSESMRIMRAMRDSQHIDPDIFELFIASGVYRRYAEKFLLPEQIDDIDETALLA